MHISLMGDLANIEKLAKQHNAVRMSIQSSYTFVDFPDAASAAAFDKVIRAARFRTLGVNTKRGLSLIEVAVKLRKGP